MRTAVRLDDELLARAKAFAARTGRTLSAVIEEALRAALAREQRRPGLRRRELPTFGAGGSVPGIDLDTCAALSP